MDNKKEVPLDLARAGEARHFIAWKAAVAGLGGRRLNDLAVAAEAVLTDIFLSGEGETLEVESEVIGDVVKTTIRHPEIKDRRMADLDGIMEQFLDGYKLSPKGAVLVKRLQ